MLCKKCNNQVSILDDRCPHCGNDLTQVDLKTRYIDAHKINWLRRIQEELKGRYLSVEELVKSDSFLVSGFPKSKNVERISFAKDEKGSVGLEEVLKVSKRESKLKELFGWVIHNPHVHENEKWPEKALRTLPFYDDRNPEVNASAIAIKNDRGEFLYYVIAICDGLLNFMLAIDAFFKVEMVKKITLLGEMYKKNNQSFSSEDLVTLIDKLPSAAKEFEHPLLSCFFVIAHELGHICYDHVFSPTYKERTLDESRIMERHADGFAASVVERAEFSNELFLSQLKSFIAWAIIEKEGGTVEPGTHPLGNERLKNYIRDNSELSKSLGIDEKWVTEVFG